MHYWSTSELIESNNIKFWNVFQERVNDKIGRLVTEVAAVADDVRAVMRMENSVAAITLNGEMTRNVDSSLGKETSLAEPHEPLVATQMLMEMLPPLVNFAIISQGRGIVSSPKRVSVT